MPILPVGRTDGSFLWVTIALSPKLSAAPPKDTLEYMVRKVEPQQNSAPRKFSLISDAKLKQIYAAMLKCRLLDVRLRQLHRQSKGSYLSSAGLEAAIVASTIDLRRDDWLLPQRRNSIASFVRGESLSTIFSNIETEARAASQEEPVHDWARLSRTLPTPPTTGAQLDIAIGLAIAAQSRKKGNVVVLFCKAAPTTTSQLRQSLAFAATHALPLVMLKFSSLRSGASSPGRKSPAGALIVQAHSAGVPAIPVDQADAVAIYRVAFESIHKARHDGGPTLIEAAIWPALPKPNQAKNPASNDPVARMEDYLAGKGLFSELWKQSIIKRFMAQAEILQMQSSRKK